MDRKDDMDLELLKNMLSDVPDTDEFDLDSIIAEVSGQAPAKAAEPMPKAAAEPEKPVEPQPAPAAETKAEEPQTAPRNKKDKIVTKNKKGVGNEWHTENWAVIPATVKLCFAAF